MGADAPPHCGIADSEMGYRRLGHRGAFHNGRLRGRSAIVLHDRMMPLAREFPHVSAYLDRLTKRPSYARALTEAQP